MNSYSMKLVAIITLIVMFLFAILPTVQATTQNSIQSDENTQINNIENNLAENTMEDNLDKEENKNEETGSEEISDFQVMLAGILNTSEEDLTIDNIPTLITNISNKKGIWISEESREYVVNLINELTNKIYKCDTDGFLEEDKEKTKEKIQEGNYVYYTQKVDELLQSEKLIVISIENTYKQLNTIDNDIIDITLEDDDYVLQFKENEKDDKSNEIIILNNKKYNEEKNADTIALLLNKILEVYYHEDEAFIKILNDKEFIDNSGTYYNIFTQKDMTEQNDGNIDKENSEDIIEEEKNDDTNEIKPDEIVELNEKDNIFDDNVPEEYFDLVLAGILTKDVKCDNINEILEGKISKQGIWIGESSREAFLKFINEHTIYTYSCDKDGYLICDNIMKDNPNLDTLEKSETEFDIEYKKLISEKKIIIIDITNNYLQYDKEKNITQINLNENEYEKSFSNNDRRIIILNDMYYKNAGYDLALSDYFVKALENVQEKVIKGELTFNKQPLTRSDTSKPGNMTSAQNVYAGPDSSNYFKVGSVSNGEMVYLLGQQAGWYHIQYMVTGTSQQKSGFVPVSTVNNNGHSVHEEQMTGGQKYPKQGLEVMSVDDSSIYVKVGSVYQGEGVTVLYDYGYSDSNKGYGISYIEFSTASGTKRGYVYTDQLQAASYPTSVARVIDTNSAYAGPDNSYVKLGGAYYNEFVTVLAKNTGNDWVFVEYNTPSGRKRGYMSYSKLHNYNHPGMYNDLAVNQGLRQATKDLTVYGGPNNNNANIGSIFSQEVVSLFGEENGYAYIEYSTTSGAKRGYVEVNSLIAANPPTIPDIPTYANFTSGTYGNSGLGKPLKYYKIGSGSNVAFAVFEQHGWEDEWAYDGIELVKIADRVMSNLSNSGINGNWTLYVIPYANPDGITNGYTNNGPGRCTVVNKVDMNRCWPANFKPTYTNRNYTGDTPLGTPEAKALQTFITNNMGNGNKILLDIHGWLNQTYGNAEVAKYFTSQFGFSHSNTYGSGYLETWGKSMGIKSVLVELPKPSSANDIINRDFSGKISNAIRDMLNGASGGPTEGGTEVNEQVKVIANGGLNVRSGPGTSYSIVSSVTQGTIVTRIRKNVATANGYVWDKIRLSNGIEGFVATNYLQIITGTGNNLSAEQVKIVKAYCRFNKINGYLGEINETYDDNIYLTVKEFQRINELPQTGYITVNDSTWIKMELNNSKEYDLYKKIAENYNNHKNPYGPGEYVVPESDYGVKFKIDKSKANVQQEEQWNKEASKFNTMTAEDRVKKAGDMAATTTTLKTIAVASGNLFPHASDGIVHYLGKTGSTHYLTDGEIAQFLDGSDGRKNLVNKYTGESKNAIEHMLTIDKVANFSMDQAMPLELSALELDWFALLGNYYFSIEGECFKKNNLYSMVGEYKIQDYYDFDTVEGLVAIIDAIKQGNVDDVAESRVGDLHYAGLAKFYYVEGTTTFNAQWYK